MLQVANELLMLREDNSVVQFSDATFLTEQDTVSMLLQVVTDRLA